MTVIAWEEVVQGTNTDTDEEQRIQEKETIYRRLIEQEAQKYGRTFEEMEVFEEEDYQILDAEDPELYELVAQKKGISPYEANLDLRIGFLQALNKYAPDFRDTARLTRD